LMLPGEMVEPCAVPVPVDVVEETPPLIWPEELSVPCAALIPAGVGGETVPDTVPLVLPPGASSGEVVASFVVPVGVGEETPPLIWPEELGVPCAVPVLDVGPAGVACDVTLSALAGVSLLPAAAGVTLGGSLFAAAGVTSAGASLFAAAAGVTLGTSLFAAAA
jgi:hypothetical protein